MSTTNQLEAWLAQEREVLARLEAGVGPGRGQAGAAGRQERPGDDAGACCAANCPTRRSPGRWISRWWKSAKGRAVFQGTPGPAHLNPMGTIHGGWYATLLDSALGCAVHTMMPAGRGYTTAELGVNLVRAIGPKAPRVRAEGKVIHCGRQLATAEGRLYGPDGTLYAHATTTCLVFDLPATR